MTGPVAIRPERPGDRDAIFAVHRAAFGQEAEAALVDRLRADGDLVLSLVAADGEDSRRPCRVLAARGAPAGRAAALAPVAVVPARRRQGIAAALIREGLARLTEDGQDLVLVLGEPAYYGRFGFTAEAARRSRTPL